MKVALQDNRNSYISGKRVVKSYKNFEPDSKVQASKPIAFRAKGPDKIGKMFSNIYSEKLMNSNRLQNISEKMSKWHLPGNMTEHLAVLGSALTSGVYMQRTLTNKDMNPDKRRTLSINQAMCFVIPTIGGYTVNHMLNGKIKEAEYRYAGLKEQAKKLNTNMSKDEIKNFEKLTGSRLKNFRALAGLAVFTLIYRYITPVAVTPLANKIGNRINEKKKVQQAQLEAQTPQIQAQNESKEIVLEPKKELRVSA